MPKDILEFTMFALIVPVVIYTELRDGKIYNWLTLPAIAIGLMLGALAGMDVLRDRFWGMLVGGGALLIPYLISGASRGRPIVGGGDVKLSAAIGAIGGTGFCLAVLSNGVLLGGALGLGMVMWRVYHNRRVAADQRISPWMLRIPFGTALCVGIMVVFARNYLMSSASLE